MIKLDNKFLDKFVGSEEVKNMQPIINIADQMLREKTGAGSDFTGWVDGPTNLDQAELTRIKAASKKINKDSDVLIVIGIGGSYLGSKAVLEFINHTFENEVNNQKTKIYFAGQNISSSYLNDLTEIIKNKDFSINIISKSGTTTEPALAFRHFKNILVNKYGEEQANMRIYATTDQARGTLKEQANSNGWESFVIPDDIGGRFSVLTAVGLLPIAVSDIDIDQLILGAKEAQEKYSQADLNTNDAYLYAAYRNVLYNKGKTIEMLIGYEPGQTFLNEWWKQLFGESEGKENKGIFPASAIFSTDLHSLGQYVQEGRRDLFETVIFFDQVKSDLTIESDKENKDELNYLASKKFADVNKKAFIATSMAHYDGGVPNIILNVKDMSTRALGHLIYFFEISCAISGYLLGVNPFDQPGVEEYKKNMFALLGKDGYNDLKIKLESRIK